MRRLLATVGFVMVVLGPSSGRCSCSTTTTTAAAGRPSTRPPAPPSRNMRHMRPSSPRPLPLSTTTHHLLLLPPPPASSLCNAAAARAMAVRPAARSGTRTPRPPPRRSARHDEDDDARAHHRAQQQQQQQQQQQRLRSARPLVPHSIAHRFTSAGSSRGSQAVAAAAVVAAVAFYLYNSQTVPVTGRRRFNFLSDAYVERAHRRDVEAVIRAVHDQGGRFLSDWDPRTVVVKRVMKRLIPLSGLPEQEWEIHVIADDRTANAFVLPGGKVFVCSGLIPVCRTEDGLAAVLGHEIAHNTASHAAERLSAAWIGSLTAGSCFFLAGALPGLALFALWNVVGGFYIQDLLYYLPMGRKQESEADYIGLMMMAEACYDPRQAIAFWQRMESISRAATGGDAAAEQVPEMLSTHPSVSPAPSRPPVSSLSGTPPVCLCVSMCRLVSFPCPLRPFFSRVRVPGSQGCLPPAALPGVACGGPASLRSKHCD
ncbi:Peptidase M48 [Moelleriella libera RCEF 2490]|uniref:Peptidase M48 n=1 Tax=Moelleriella libera RCEF 2490 TaxID=1081109 RepID=A0A166VDH2_9HYPO|nr:Peptidase M48 [Moelleriella libera RCEF 2490]